MLHKIVVAAALIASSTLVTAQNQCWFSAPVALSNLGTQLTLVGDADLDGDVDAIMSGRTAGGLDYVEVLFNDGCDLVPGGQIPIPGGRGTAIAFVDIGGDGIRDLIVATTGRAFSGVGPGLYIYVGLPGGTFAPPVFKVTWGFVTSFLEGDANGDGFPDFFSQEATGSTMVSLWYHGASNNTLTGTQVSVLPSQALGTTGAYPYPTVVVDVDGDQIDDVVMATFLNGTDQLSMFGTQAGGFVPLPQVPIAAGFTSFKDILVVDSDQDGDDDIALSYAGAPLQIVQQLSPGNWQALPVLLGPAPGQLIGGDWDGDGDTDLIMRERTNMGTAFHYYRHLENVGGNGFNVSARIEADGQLSYGVTCADMNGDGFLDYVEDSNIIYGDGTFDGPDAGGDLLVDWDGDGDLDYTDGDTLYENDGGANYTATPIAFPAPPSGSTQTAWFDLGDTNGDGLRELVVQYSPGVVMRMLTETPAGAFVDVGPGPPFASEPKQILMDDFDGDGDLDAYAYEYVYLNDGNYGFAVGPYLGPTQRPVAVCDVDGDGDMDVVTRSVGVHSVHVAYRNGNTFTSTMISAGPGWHGNIEVSAVVADLDDDGDDDIAASFRLNTFFYEVRLLTNNAGSFTLAAALPHNGPLTAGDIDGDGATDLCVGEAGYFGVLRRSGPGLIYDPIEVYSVAPPTHLVDLDQDGDLDVFGEQRALSPRSVAPDAGYRRQYGLGSAGSGGWRPQVSVTGTVREGTMPSIRMQKGIGGSVGFLIVGLSEANTPSVVLPGVLDYIGSVQIIAGFGLSGTLGQAGAGAVEVPLAVPPGAFGTNWFLEFVVYDPGLPGQFSYTNGCEMFVGM